MPRVKLSEVAEELGMRDRLSLVVNRANSGVSVSDVEKALGLPVYAQIRSGGMLLVKASNEGRMLVDMAPREKITAEFQVLADRLLGASRARAGTGGTQPVRTGAQPHAPDPGRIPDLPSDQRARSCQLVPPSGEPGSFTCGSPVRLSTCTTPRR